MLPRRLGWLVPALTSAIVLQSIFHHPLGVIPGALALALVALAAIRPFDGLLVLAGLGPLATMVLVASGNAAGVQFSEALTLAYLTGASGRLAVFPRPLNTSPWLRWAAVLLMVTAMASLLTLAPSLRAERLNVPFTELSGILVWRDYLSAAPGSAAVSAALLVCECALLLLLVADASAGDMRRRDAILRMMVCGAGAAAFFNVLRVVMLSVQQPHPLHAFVDYIPTIRVNVHFGDRNAAGSYFALMLLIAIATAIGNPLVAAVCAPLAAAGLWLSGSRFALGGVFLACLAGTLIVMRGRVRRRLPLAVFVLLIAAAAGLWAVYPRGRNYAASKALNIRLDLARAGIQMMREHPVFGVGPSRYYALSDRYAGPALTALGYERENAHNYFIQIGAELGAVGLTLFTAILIMCIRRLWRSARPLPAMSIGLLCGIAAYAITCIGGHPLLVAEAAYPFWMALGLAAALPAWVSRTPRALSVTGAILVAVLAVTVPWRAADAMHHASLEGSTAGLSQWQHEPDGSRYRWADARSTFFVTAGARAIRVPLMNENAEKGTIIVRVLLDGREADRVKLPPDREWRLVRLFPERTAADYYRIDLIVEAAPDTGSDRRLFRVGQPRIEP